MNGSFEVPIPKTAIKLTNPTTNLILLCPDTLFIIYFNIIINIFKNKYFIHEKLYFYGSWCLKLYEKKCQLNVKRLPIPDSLLCL